MSVANRLWGQEGFDFRPEFLATTRESYGAELAQVDFARQAEPARRRINAWVEEQTQGKITDLIPPGVLDAMTRLVLTNAIYFKGDWAEPFQKSATKDAPFHVTARQQADVPLMHQQDDFRYWAGDGLKVLELPYGKGDLAMLVLLPDEIEGLAGPRSRADRREPLPLALGPAEARGPGLPAPVHADLAVPAGRRAEGDGHDSGIHARRGRSLGHEQRGGAVPLGGGPQGVRRCQRGGDGGRRRHGGRRESTWRRSRRNRSCSGPITRSCS